MFDRPSPKLLFDFFDAPDLKVAKDFALLFDFPDLVDLVPFPRPARLMSLKLSST